MKIRFSLLTLLLLLAPVCYAQNATVAAWNIKGFDPIPATRTRLIARAIHNMSPDVIALSEVNTSTGEETLDLLVDTLADLGDDYTYIYFPQTSTQSLALLFKDGVEVADDQLIEGSDDNNSALRKALAARVRIRRFDFILILVHMKSARGNEERATRTRQARAIAGFITDATSGNEKDVLLIGDYNMIPGDDDVNFQAISPGPNNNEFLRFVSTESLSGRISHFSTCNPVRGNLLDGYAISRSFTREYREGSLRLIPFTNQIFRQAAGTTLDCARYNGFFSDHLPLIARFRATQDDD
ncbi:MAG TPA: endonuclease/exonuclease/phosphatase family protein [Nitrososphaera sp.]|nr:endonuclease/exonuclease/phosphatase family protein [Nitrososphaera sp.]